MSDKEKRVVEIHETQGVKDVNDRIKDGAWVFIGMTAMPDGRRIYTVGRVES